MLAQELAKLPHVKELLGDIKIADEIKNQISLPRLFQLWWDDRSPTLIQRQDCADVISGATDSTDPAFETEIHQGAKLALMAYALPYFYQEIAHNFHLKNINFNQYFERHVAEAAHLAFRHMDTIIEGITTIIPLKNQPEAPQLAGFYIRTPIRLWHRGRRVQRLPRWEERTNLLEYKVVGNTNVYVLRDNTIGPEQFDLYVLFRGTSNEFNAIHQYGKNNVENTPVFRYPKYEPHQQKFYRQGHARKPLFYYYYVTMIEDIKEHIYQALTTLGVESDHCRRVVISGHSMGGALTLTFAYLSRYDRPGWWSKFFFRTYAAPFCCNYAAVLRLEQWVLDSKQKYKFMEIMNTDDMVNILHYLGGQEGIKEALGEGSMAVVTWLARFHGSIFKSREQRELLSSVMRVAQTQPERLASAFFAGAVESQINNFGEMVEDEKKYQIPLRLGQRPAEVKLWNSTRLRNLYNETLAVVFCRRRISTNEYFLKSHTDYLNLSMNAFWSSLRLYEDTLYRYYARVGLRRNNELRVVGIFPEADVNVVKPVLKKYAVPLYQPPAKFLKT